MLAADAVPHIAARRRHLEAQDPERLAAIKAKLRRNRQASHLFDTARFTRDLEAAYTMM
jgi:predicted O-linked N-acetylglucosamine transferase (SPINDLY family)